MGMVEIRLVHYCLVIVISWNYSVGIGRFNRALRPIISVIGKLELRGKHGCGGMMIGRGANDIH
jgi:hypothetical protein